MDIPVRKLDVKCIECGKHFEATTHKRMGMIKVVCSHCNASQEYMVKPVKVGATSDNGPVAEFKTHMPVPILGQAVNQGGRYVIEKRAKIGKQSSFICPKCSKSIAIKPTAAGEYGVMCKDCGTRVFITSYDAEAEEQRQREAERIRQEQEAIRRQQEEQRRLQEEQKRQEEEQRRLQEEPVVTPEPEVVTPEPEVVKPEPEIVTPQPEVVPPQEPTQESDPTVIAAPKRRLTNGELHWGGGFLSSAYKIKLLTGSTIVGRKDPNTPSDIQFNDPEMSRRSVQIDAEPRNGAMTFSLTVLKDLNPVTVNGRRVPQGMSVILRSGAKITMGQTVITFKQV